MASRRGRGDFREIDGILNFDKPVGISSNQALQQVRQLYRARKAGHCGSLDPLASGVLPICLGEATKFSSFLLAAGKRYRAECRLGQTTTTGDAEGELLEQRDVEVDQDRVEAALESFRGEIMQVPPMYSALKHQGKRLYQLAREGIQVERKPRPVTIHGLDMVALTDDCLTLDVRCSKGTYIRTLAEDIGAVLGCGAHLLALRRTAVDNFNLEDAVSIESLQALAPAGMERIDRLLQPVATALSQFPELELDAAGSLEICQGKRVQTAASVVTGLHRLRSADGRFLGLGEVFAGGELAPKRLMNTAR